MTRKNFAKGILAFIPFAAQAAKKQCYPVTSIWETPQGQYVLALRAELKRLEAWDDLSEDWQVVEEALKDGHMFFLTSASRLSDTKMFYKIQPIYYQKETVTTDKKREYVHLYYTPPARKHLHR